MAKRAMTDEAKAIKAQMILDKTAEMFTSSDYNSIKMSDIAKEMNMSNGILFVYFRTKEALFFSLLCKEYEKRILRLREMVINSKINDFNNFSTLIMRELVELIDNHPLYIRLESMRAAILEKNIDAETMLNQKVNLYSQMIDLATLISKNNALTTSEVMDIFQTESSIITGCKLSASLPAEVLDIVDKNGLEEFKRDFKKDVINTMRYYLDGRSQN